MMIYDDYKTSGMPGIAWMFYVCEMKTTETCSRLAAPRVQHKHEQTDLSLHTCLGIYIHFMHLQMYIV
jgi:hypothetical protein